MPSQPRQAWRRYRGNKNKSRAFETSSISETYYPGNMSTSAVPGSLSLSSAADRDLVVSAAQGLEGGFEELVRRYQRPISGYVYRMVGDYESALDLTQEIFIKIYGSLSRYRP